MTGDELPKHSFEEMSSNIYYRIHDAICVDILEIINKKEYFTVSLSVYCLKDRKFNLYPVVINNLGNLKNPLFKNYWWKIGEGQEEILSLLEKFGEKFWKEYSSLDKVMNTIKFCMSHSAFKEEVDDELLDLWEAIQKNEGDFSFIKDLYKILKTMKANKSKEEFRNQAVDWNSRSIIYTMNHYYEDDE